MSRPFVPSPRILLRTLLLLTLFLGWTSTLTAQSVSVTLRLDTNTIAVGGTTTLRVFGQVVPTLRADADRIFSWYLDVLNTNGSIAQANYNAMQKAASDRHPQTSSTGFNSGANRHGIYDTFQDFAGAGVTNP